MTVKWWWLPVLVSLCVGISAAPARAEEGPCTISWAGDESGAWNVAANWSPARVPGPADDVCIDRGEATPTVTVSASATVDWDFGFARLIAGAAIGQPFADAPVHLVNRRCGRVTAAQRQLAGGLPQRNGGFRKARGSEVMRQHLRFSGGDVREVCFDHACDLRVQVLSAAFE